MDLYEASLSSNKLDESSILADVENTMKSGDNYAKMQESLDFTAKFNKKYELDLFSKTDHCKQQINVGDVILCWWLGAVRPGVVIAISDDSDKKLTVTFDGNTDTNFNVYRKNNRLVAFDIEPFRAIKCTPKLIKAIKDLI